MSPERMPLQSIEPWQIKKSPAGICSPPGLSGIILCFSLRTRFCRRTRFCSFLLSSLAHLDGIFKYHVPQVEHSRLKLCLVISNAPLLQLAANVFQLFLTAASSSKNLLCGFYQSIGNSQSVFVLLRPKLGLEPGGLIDGHNAGQQAQQRRDDISHIDSGARRLSGFG